MSQDLKRAHVAPPIVIRTNSARVRPLQKSLRGMTIEENIIVVD